MSAGLDTDSRTAWISQGFERLIDRVRKAPTAIHFDDTHHRQRLWRRDRGGHICPLRSSGHRWRA